MIPKEFTPPAVFETDAVRIRCLTIDDVIKDYDAVMTSINHLQTTKPFGPHDDWPTKELTLKQDLIDLGWHQKEFQRRTSFAYTVMSLNESKCLGCVYIYPSPNKQYDAEIIMWVREDELQNNLDDHLYTSVRNWIQNRWPFQNPGYPGRAISWEKWDALRQL